MLSENPSSPPQEKIITRLKTFIAHGRQHGFALIHKMIFLIAIILLLVCIWWIWHIITHAKKDHHAQLINVVLATAQKTDVPVYLNALGSVTPLDSVTVKSQVNGQMQQVFFKEGQMVKRNALLAQIDERPFRALLNQYQGQLAHDLALLENARLDLKRYETLWKEDSVSKQTLDTQTSLVKQYEGAVKSDRGLVDTARVNLIFCRIISPIDGRIGLRLVDPGNFVQTTDTTGLFVINKLNPITSVFVLPEDNIPQIMKSIKAGKKLITKAYDRSQNKLLSTGILHAVDNQIDPTTGTVKLKAHFKNDDDVLFPNQFVNIKLLVDTLSQAIVIPTPAIQRGTHNFVYKYDSNTQTVHMTPITTGMVEGDNTVVTKGINPGDVIVVEGTDKLIDNMKVMASPENHQSGKQ
ncbi:MAG: efflux RND transporter periplasmic adaptor subunit [Candidatus Berkiellales bacterium]